MPSRTMDSYESQYRHKQTNRLSHFYERMGKWLVFFGCAVAYVVFIEAETLRHGLDHRVLDVFCHLVAAATGISFGHTLVKLSMDKTKANLQMKVTECMNELRQQLEAQKTEKRSEPLPLPIPYIVSRLRDKDDSGFGYFGAKLLNRDPRLLLDLALDEALPPGGDREIWDLTREIQAANRVVEASSPSGLPAEKIAKNVVDALIAKLRPEAESAVNEALRKAQEQSKPSDRGGPSGETK
jgi:hypothetical protein